MLLLDCVTEVLSCLAGFCDRGACAVEGDGDVVVVNAPDGRSKAEEVERSGIMDMGSER